MRVLGIMSGTSADGLDLVLAEFWGDGPRWHLLLHQEVAYPEALRQRVLEAMRGRADTRELALLHHDLGRFVGEAARPFRGQAELGVYSGQTLWHEPPRATLQLGEAQHLAEALGVPVVGNLRAADLALGGEGAPLVAYPDLLLFGQEGTARAIHNLGGISNLTYFRGLDPQTLLAFDTGPGNCLLDEAASTLGLPYDADGALARKGIPDEAYIRRWLQHPFFSQPPPKTTGREVWNLERLNPAGLEGADLLATLLHFTARSIAQAYLRFVLPQGLDAVYLAGGGARNRYLVETLKSLLPVPLLPLEALGVPAKAREAMAFALLGYLRWQGVENVLGRVTGARGNAIAGQVALPGRRL